jgi:hypothetical protein
VSLLVRIQPTQHPIQTGEWVWFRDGQEFESIAYRVVGTSGDDALIVEELDPQPADRTALVRPVTLAPGVPLP